MKSELILIDENGNKVKCDVVAKWSLDGNDYVAYTDEEINNDELNIYLSKCVNDNGQLKVFDITDDKEWEKANNYLEEILHELEDGDIE